METAGVCVCGLVPRGGVVRALQSVGFEELHIRSFGGCAGTVEMRYLESVSEVWMVWYSLLKTMMPFATRRSNSAHIWVSFSSI